MQRVALRDVAAHAQRLSFSANSFLVVDVDVGPGKETWFWPPGLFLSPKGNKDTVARDRFAL